jgi:hypothetical protein
MRMYLPHTFAADLSRHLRGARGARLCAGTRSVREIDILVPIAGNIDSVDATESNTMIMIIIASLL